MEGQDTGRTIGGGSPPCKTHESNCAQGDDDVDDDAVVVDDDDDDDGDGFSLMLLCLVTRCAPFINDAATLQNGGEQPQTLTKTKAFARINATNIKM